MSRYLRTYSRVRAISNKSNESNEYERTRIKVRSFVANGYSLRIVSCSEDSFDSRPCSLIIYSNGLKFGRFVRCPSLDVPVRIILLAVALAKSCELGRHQEKAAPCCDTPAVRAV